MTVKTYRNPKITAQVRAIWEDLGQTPVNDDGQIEEIFGGFPAGTDREEIWHWIEATFDVSVHELMFPGEHKPTGEV